MKRVPYKIIKAAKTYDAEAVEFIFRHYESYIISQCRAAYEQSAQADQRNIDDDLYYRARNAVFAAISGFIFQDPSDDFMP